MFVLPRLINSRVQKPLSLFGLGCHEQGLLAAKFLPYLSLHLRKVLSIRIFKAGLARCFMSLYNLFGAVERQWWCASESRALSCLGSQRVL